MNRCLTSHSSRRGNRHAHKLELLSSQIATYDTKVDFKFRHISS
jgi:hypothetical protein